MDKTSLEQIENGDYEESRKLLEEYRDNPDFLSYMAANGKIGAMMLYPKDQIPRDRVDRAIQYAKNANNNICLGYLLALRETSLPTLPTDIYPLIVQQGGRSTYHNLSQLNRNIRTRLEPQRLSLSQPRLMKIDPPFTLENMKRQGMYPYDLAEDQKRGIYYFYTEKKELGIIKPFGSALDCNFILRNIPDPHIWDKIFPNIPILFINMESLKDKEMIDIGVNAIKTLKNTKQIINDDTRRHVLWQGEIYLNSKRYTFNCYMIMLSNVDLNIKDFMQIYGGDGSIEQIATSMIYGVNVFSQYNGPDVIWGEPQF